MATNVPALTPSGGSGSAGTRFALVSNASVITATSLLGDTDGDYELIGTLLLPAAPVNNAITLQPNADTGNATLEFVSSANGVTSSSSSTSLLIGVPNTTGLSVVLTFLMRFASKSGDGNHLYSCSAFYLDNSGHNNFIGNGQYTSTTTQITSLVVATNQANSLLSGSFVRIRKLGFTA
jgi:hypothetical protein